MDNKQNEQGLSIVDTLLNRSSKETVALIKQAIQEGEANPAYVGVVLKKFAKVAEVVKKDKELIEVIETDTKTYQEGTAKTFSVYGAKVTIASGGFWDYSNTNDPYLTKLQEIEALMKEMIKKRKEEIVAKTVVWNTKNTPQNVINFGIKAFTLTWDDMPNLTWDEAVGEVTTNPPVKIGKETLRYTL